MAPRNEEMPLRGRAPPLALGAERAGDLGRRLAPRERPRELHHRRFAFLHDDTVEARLVSDELALGHRRILTAAGQVPLEAKVAQTPAELQKLERAVLELHAETH
jgi:hypothetical protein